MYLCDKEYQLEFVGSNNQKYDLGSKLRHSFSTQVVFRWHFHLRQSSLCNFTFGIKLLLCSSCFETEFQGCKFEFVAPSCNLQIQRVSLCVGAQRSVEARYVCWLWRSYCGGLDWYQLQCTFIQIECSLTVTLTFVAPLLSAAIWGQQTRCNSAPKVNH